MVKQETPKSKEKNDVLEVYPEKKQVDSFPERRYIKLTRFLTIVTLSNLAMVIAWAGIYFYMTKNIDMSISAGNRVQFYTIDPERKVLIPSEAKNVRLPALQLEIEKNIRKYLEQRYSSVYEMDEMQKRWGNQGYVAALSSQEVAQRFKTEKERALSEIQTNRVRRDLHIYSLYPVYGMNSDLWSAYIETFDFVVDDNLEKKCNCTDNSEECLLCKNTHAQKKVRRKILLRASYTKKTSQEDSDDEATTLTYNNPLGIKIYAYYSAVVPPSNESYWDLPPALRAPL